MTQINLVPADLLQRREANRRLRRWMLRLMLGIAVMGAAYLAAQHAAARQGTQAEKKTSQFAGLQERFRRAEHLIGERDRLALRLDTIQTVVGGRRAGWLLEILEENLAGDTYLSFLMFNRCTDPRELPHPPADADDCVPTIKMRGFAPGHKEVGNLIGRLASSGEFAQVSLLSVRNAGEPRTDVVFELLCQLETD